MIGHWCGKSFGVFAVALSASALGACASHSYELGKAEGGAGGSGATGGGKVGGGGTSAAGKGGSVNEGGTGDEAPGVGQGGSSIARGGSATMGSGGGTIGGTSAGGSTALGGTAGSAGSIDLTSSLLRELAPAPTKLDLLLMIDNSISMAEKQSALAGALPGLLQRFRRCVDADGGIVGDTAPNCPPDSRAEFGQIEDIHLGIITSSLGDHGSGDVCSQAQDEVNVQNGGTRSNYNDRAQLLPSVREGLDTGSDQDFLGWQPTDDNADSNLADFIDRMKDEVTAVGERGCGYEGQLESWYRFLVDPEPVADLTHSDDRAVTVRGGVNGVVQQQRAAFLRSDSVLAIVMLTDENDCSILDEDGAQGWLVPYKGGVNQTSVWHMPRATAACATNPNDPSCHPCLADDPDPECAAKGVNLSITEDSMNMRCFHEVQRFGIDLLYPVGRYVQALTSPTIVPRFGGASVPNPLFQPSDGRARTADQVVLAGIVGVPWQDVAATESIEGSGLELLTAEELVGEGRWDLMLGDATGVPTDPFMIESIDPRPTGARHPLVPDAAILSPDDTGNNGINGHEQAALAIRDDLQFACIYALPSPVQCNDQNADSCDCNYDDSDRKSPLCDGATATTDGEQVSGKAYPSVRELQVLKGVGSNAVVASVCPKYTYVGPPDSADDGYTPALTALGNRLARSFAAPCLPRSLPISQCAVIEARPSDGGDCDLPGRTTPDGYGAEVAQNVTLQLSAQGYDIKSTTLCQVQPLEGEELDACQNTAEGGTGPGFCYLDADQNIGDPNLLRMCPDSMKHMIRFVADALPQTEGARTFVECADGR